MKKISGIILAFFAIFFICSADGAIKAYEVGVYYYPGWANLDLPWMYGWKHIMPFPEREPLLGWYPEEEQWVADTHLTWAYNFGITFFAYDWYYDGKQANFDHAIKNYLKSPLKSKVKFAILWANHSEIPRNKKEFEHIVDFWIENYFSQPSYYTIDRKLAVFIFSNHRLNLNAKKFGSNSRELLEWASERCMDKIGKEIYFIATINDKPTDGLELSLKNSGYSAYTGWNYVTSEDQSKVADYTSMVKTYKNFYKSASSTKKRLKYIVPASPGWDDSPWKGKEAFVRENPTPEKFRDMLIAAKEFLDKEAEPKIIMIEAWNEFGEGSYIEPTKKWGFKYLETIKEVLGGE